MDGGCISVWVEKQLTLNERLLLQKYEFERLWKTKPNYGVGVN